VTNQSDSLITLLAAVVLAIASFGSRPLWAQDWRPDFSLSPRPDGPGVETLSKPEPVTAHLFDGPSSAAQFQAWLHNLEVWREQRKREIGYHDDLYAGDEVSWSRLILTQDQLLVWDRSLYDPIAGRYTIDRALAEIERRFGPLDSVLIWPGYPNLGLDDRNQFDLMRDLPGGVAGLRQMVAAFHQRGVKVFFPMLDWDEGTRDPGISRAANATELLHEIGADGINLDTLNSIPEDLRRITLAMKPQLALEPQLDPQNASLASSAISWDDWVLWDDLAAPFIPRVSQVKWLEPRHMVEVTDRYALSKANSLQHAFFNGEGYALLENLWGYWDGFSPRDAEAVRRFTRIERAYADLLTSAAWEPHTPMLQPGIFASRFPGNGQTLWTIVNRNEYEVDGEQLAVPVQPGMHYYDLWHGVELAASLRNGNSILSFPIESLGFGAVLARAEETPSRSLAQLLAAAARDAREPLSSFSREAPVALQTMAPIDASPKAKLAPRGMVTIPAADYEFVVDGIEIENANNPGVDVQFPWESSPRRNHRHLLHIPRFFIDRTPVTNAEFKRFVESANYHPLDDHNFLRDWSHGTFPAGWGNKPVTWVSIEDARAYARWAGKRLPHVWEWQYAAQATDGRPYPWGATWASGAVPAVDHSRTRRPPTNVDAFPAGASPFGVLDMEGNVAQWTDEFTDAHTRAAVLRGGDFYRPLGALWYFPKSDRLDEQEKYLLMSPGRDRTRISPSATRVFRDASSDPRWAIEDPSAAHWALSARAASDRHQPWRCPPPPVSACPASPASDHGCARNPARFSPRVKPPAGSPAARPRCVRSRNPHPRAREPGLDCI
jgi:formylglycine-generating enzyme required for sulfatase activity